MAATVMEGALDLSSSAKPSDVQSTSPVPSVTSDTDSQLGEAPGERSESVSSDGHDTDGSTSTAVKAIAGPIPGMIPSPKIGSAEAAASEGQGMPGSMRPFKMYPFEPLPGVYSQMAASASAAGAGMMGMAPISTGAMSPFPMGMGMLDTTAAMSLSSPIMSYLQSRKRRVDAKSASDSDPEDSKKGKFSGGESKDEHYWERRRKNNEAAKRSRDARRAKEEEIALRAAFLEQENLKLRAQVAILKNETAKLHYMLYNRM